MLEANHILLYVADARRSCQFYGALLDLQPVEAQDTFCMFRLPSGVMLGLWGAAGGYTFTACDAGGHRLRVFALTAA